MGDFERIRSIEGGKSMDTIPAMIIGVILVVYGLFVHKGKMLWFLKLNSHRLRDETGKKYKSRIYKTYGMLFIIIGLMLLVIGCILYSKGIVTTKNNNLY
jgi:hypothetical protein